MIKTPSSDTGRPSNLVAEFMVIELGYSCKLLLPIEEGNNFLSAYSRAREWQEEYSCTPKILPSPPAIKVQYMTRAQLAKIRFDDMLEPDDG